MCEDHAMISAAGICIYYMCIRLDLNNNNNKSVVLKNGRDRVNALLLKIGRDRVKALLLKIGRQSRLVCSKKWQTVTAHYATIGK